MEAIKKEIDSLMIIYKFTGRNYLKDKHWIALNDAYSSLAAIQINSYQKK